MVEDHEGTADLLSLYNINIGLDDDVFFPADTYFALRAPYYKLSASGNYTLRSDHPSDILKLDHNHFLVKQFRWADDYPGIFEVEQDVRAIKEEGNCLFRQGKFHAASEEYSKGIRSRELVRCSDLWAVLYCNRAITHLRISQYEGALNDCQEVLRSNPQHHKALYLKARALYCLRKFDESRLLCENFLDLESASSEGKSLLEDTLKRLHESITGNFDFSDMKNKAGSQKCPRLDYGDYIGPVDVRACCQSSKGRGMFATRDIVQGELLLCEKALQVCYVDEVPMQTTINTVKKKAYMGSDSCLPSRVVQLLYDNPSIAGPFFDLYSGNRDRPTRNVPSTAEGNPIIDSFTVSAILDFNAFKPENAANLIENPLAASRAMDPVSDVGIWIHASYLNHSCTGNVLRACIGDFIILRALRPIKKGEELHHSYVPTLNELKDREGALGKFGFTCRCELCNTQRTISEQELRSRKRAVDTFQKFKNEVLKTDLVQPGPSISRARKLIKNIRKTYSNPKYCVDILIPYAFLFRLQYSAGRKTDCITNLQEIIHLVSGVDVSNLDKFEPIYCPGELMFLFLGLCIALEDVGDKDRAAKCKETTRFLYGIVSGLGYEATQISDILKKFRNNINGQIG